MSIIGIFIGLVAWSVFWSKPLYKRAICYIKEEPFNYDFGWTDVECDLGLGFCLFGTFLFCCMVGFFVPFLLPVVIPVLLIYGFLRALRFANRVKVSFKTLGGAAHTHEDGEIKKMEINKIEF